MPDVLYAQDGGNGNYFQVSKLGETLGAGKNEMQKANHFLDFCFFFSYRLTILLDY
jgi:hypothetical protein